MRRRYVLLALVFAVLLPVHGWAQVTDPSAAAPTEAELRQLFGQELRLDQEIFQTSYVRSYPDQTLHQRDSYTASFTSVTDARLQVVTTVTLPREGELAAEELPALLASGYGPSETEGWEREAWTEPAVGEATEWRHYRNRTAADPVEEIGVLGFVQGSSAVAISVSGDDRLVSLDQVARLGRLIEQRLP